MRLDGLEAVAFDLDNTLCYYALSVQEVFTEASRRAGIATESLGDLDALAKRYFTLWWELQQTTEATDRLRVRIIERLFDELGTGDPAQAARLSDAYGTVRQESGVLPFDGAADLLADLKERYRLGLLTNGPSDIQWEKIRSLGFGDAFNAIVVAGDIGVFKPDRLAFQSLLDRLGVRASESLFVGDTYGMDIIGAHEAGMRTAMIRRDPSLPLSGIIPEVEITDVTALREVLL